MSEESNTIIAKAGSTVDGVEIKMEVAFEPGDSLEDFVEQFGEEVAWSYVLAQTTRNLQNAIRSRLNAGKTEEEIRSELSTWKPGVVVRSRGSKKDPKAAFKAKFAAATAEERQAMIADLQSMLAELAD